MSYYIRRSFDASLCPTSPPKKGLQTPKGSPFNLWFRGILANNNININAFAALINEPYSTVHTWTSNNDCQCWGMCRIARGLEDLGLGNFEEIKQTIKDLKKRRKG